MSLEAMNAWQLIMLDLKINWELLTRYWYVWVIVILVATLGSVADGVGRR